MYCDVLLLQSSVLLLILSGTACTMEVNGENQVVAIETQNLTPVQMGNIRVTDLLAGLVQGNLDYCCHAVRFKLLKNNLLLLNATALIMSLCLLVICNTFYSQLISHQSYSSLMFMS